MRSPILLLVLASLVTFGCGGTAPVDLLATPAPEPAPAKEGTKESALGGSASATGGVFATFDVGGEPLSIWITNATGVRQALQIWQGRRATGMHPSGKLVCAAVASAGTASASSATASDAQEYNAPWSWHLDGATVTFASTSIELCDGRPSFVESSPCGAFANGTFCPWSAKMTALRDCRASSELPPSCPPVAR